MGLSVLNFNIENASGLNVRQDIETAFKALQGQSAESSDLADTKCVAGMTFLLQPNTLKVRNANNTGFSIIGNIDQDYLGLVPRSAGSSFPLTGQLFIDDSSSAGSPALCFDGDSDTGFFRKSADKIGVSAAGSERFFFDDNGITFNNQRQIRFGDNNSSHYIGLRADSTISNSFTLTLPTSDGSNGQFLTTNGSGVLSFTSANISGSVTVGSTSISLGGTATTIAGLTSLTSTTLVATNVQATNLTGITTLTATNLRATNFQDSSGNNGSTPAQIHKGRAKAWVIFANDGSMNANFGVSSVTDNGGSGNFTINFSSAFANVNYAFALSAGRGTGSGARIVTQEGNDGKATDKFHLKVRNDSGSQVDTQQVSAVFFAA